MIQDFRFAFRQLFKSPGFTAVAITTLALAIGVNSAIFAIINGALLRPVVPVREKEVVGLFTSREGVDHDYRPFTFAEFRELRQNSHELFADLAALEFAVAGIGQDHDLKRSFVFLTSDNFFSMMGAKPALGRFYNAEEARPNAEIAVAVASFSLWKRMGGRADFVGSTLKVNGQPYTVIGVAQDGFSGVSALVGPDLWLPLGVHSQLGSILEDSDDSSGEESARLHDLERPKNYALNLMARLQPDLTLESAKSRLPVLTGRFKALQPPDSEFPRQLRVVKPSRFSISTSPEDDGPVALIGTLLMAMAGAVLFIACLNLANMLLARGTARAKEVALRLALGASRWRIVRQLLCEGLLLALIGGIVGVIASAWFNEALLRSMANLIGSMNFSFALKLRPDFIILVATFVFCLLATLLFSLGPALRLTKSDLVNDLKQQAGEPARVGRLSRFFAPRHILVMVQIALSLVLLFSAGLFLRGALAAAALDPGFVAAGDIVSELDFNLVKRNPEQSRRTVFQMLERARQLPGVQTAAAASMLPYGDMTSTKRIMPAGATMPNDPKAPDPGAGAIYNAITPHYFEAIGVKILRGRDFTQDEVEKARKDHKVAIIDEDLAKTLFPNADAIGQHVKFTIAPTDGSPNDLEIVGVVSAHRHDLQNDNINRWLFVPWAQAYTGDMFLHVRLQTKDQRAVAGFIPTLRESWRNTDPDLPLLQLATFTDLTQKSVTLWTIRLGAVLFGIFGVVALLLAVVGVYGVKAYAVACRTREIGIRMALGARRRDVFSLIMRQGALQTALAIAVGILLSLAAGKVLAQILYAVSATDLPTLLGTSLLLATSALVACFLPARRATAVNPLTALRTE